MSDVSQTLALAWQHHQAGDLARAETLYRQALQAAPHHAESWGLLGAVLLGLGQPLEAAAALEQSCRLDPDRAATHDNLGIALAQQGRLGEAARCFEQALRRNPDCAETHANLGNVRARLEQREEAVASFRRALEIRPNSAAINFNLGNSLMELNRLEEAVTAYRQAVHLRPGYAKAYNNLGHVLQRQGKLTEAVAAFDDALRLHPEYAAAYSNRANAQRRQGRYEEAEADCRASLRLDPADAETHNNLGAVLLDQGRLAEARASFDEAVRLRPDYARGHVNRAMLRLLLGELPDAFAEYEWRWQTGDLVMPPFVQPLWDGSPMAGRTILLHAEQGLGDTLQFIRYAALIRQQGSMVVFDCPRALVRLLAGCPGIDRLVPHGEPLPSFDVHAPLMSLPRLFATSLDTVPTQVPYLTADPGLVARWRERLATVPGFRVGIAWHGNPRDDNDRRRAIPLKQFESLARLKGVSLISLQQHAGTEQLVQVRGRFPVQELGPDFDESAGPFMDTAAVMQCVNLVVTSDTAIAHLAGALGVPVWVGLPYCPEWRWLLGRTDSPWYPTARLFRQATLGRWDDVLAQMAMALRALVVSGERTSSTSAPT